MPLTPVASLRAAVLPPFTALVLALAGCGEEDGVAGEDAVPLAWLESRAAPGGRAVDIGYVNDPCTRARRAIVEEDEDTVTVTLLDPERNPEEVCIQLAKPGCARVSLSQPLAGREVVDGSASRPGPGQATGDMPFRRFRPCRPIPVES